MSSNNNTNNTSSLEIDLDSKEADILTIITRDGKIQVSNTLARQISPVLGRFMDNWNRNDTIYLNYSSGEVNKLLDEFNEPGTLKEFLLTGTGKKQLKFVDVVTSIEEYTKNMKINVFNTTGSTYQLQDRTVHMTNTYDVLVTMNEKSILYSTGWLDLNKKYYISQFDLISKKYNLICSLDPAHTNNIQTRTIVGLQSTFTTVYNRIPRLLLDFYPLN